METIYFIAILLGLALGLAVGFGTFLAEVKERKDRPHEIGLFREALKKALETKDLSLEDIQIIGRSRRVSLTSIKTSLEDLLSDAWIDSDEVTEGYVHKLKCSLRELETEEPFQGLPDEIRFHLLQIQEKMPDSAALLQPLCRQLKAMVLERTETQRRQRWVSWISLAVGIVGLCVGISSSDILG